MASKVGSMGHRQRWVDILKGISICLVVAHHLMGFWPAPDWMIKINNSLVPFRMPVFFFASGLFVGKAIKYNFSDLIRFRISYLMYLFALWAVIKISLMAVGKKLSAGGEFDFSPYLFIFTHHQSTLWFIYAIALFTLSLWLLVKVSGNKYFLILSALAVYVIGFNYGNVNDMSMAEKAPRFFICFVIGYCLYDKFIAWSEKFKSWHLAAALAYALVAWQWYSVDNDTGIMITLVMSILALPVGVIIAKSLEFKKFNFLEYLGSRTLQIYLAHFIFIQIFSRIGLINSYPISGFIFAWVVSVVGPIIIWRVAVLLKLNFLYNAPWLKKRFI